MDIKYYLGNPEELAEFVVGKSILESMAEKKRKNIIKRVAFIMKNYKSKLLVCEILSCSAEQGKLEKYLGELEMHYYQGNIQYLSPLIMLSVY